MDSSWAYGHRDGKYGSVVCNGAGLSVLNGLLDDSIHLVSSSAERGSNAAEELVRVSFAKELVERLPLGLGSLRMIVMMMEGVRLPTRNWASALRRPASSVNYHAMSREIVVSEKFPLGFLVLQGTVTLQIEVFEFGDEISLRSDASVATAKDRVRGRVPRMREVVKSPASRYGRQFRRRYAWPVAKSFGGSGFDPNSVDVKVKSENPGKSVFVELQAEPVVTLVGTADRETAST
ncbi:hypothetical protein EDD15DRAFT_2231429 [Pisolithus albus]|nr:hypothetical protein EDD15DRAFT_2231429 [Pisolithus albus]